MPKRLLLVDDEEFFLNCLKERLDSFSEIFETDICYSVNDAIKCLSDREYAIIITDIKMPDRTGIELLLHLRTINFKGKVVVMSAYNTAEMSRNIKVLGGVEVISKPFKVEWFKNVLLDWFYKIEKSPKAIHENINLVTVMQIINMEKKSTALEVEAGDKKGMIHFNDGEIIHAEFDGLEGRQAVSALAEEKDSVISVKKFKGIVPRTMKVSFRKYILDIMESLGKGYSDSGFETEFDDDSLSGNTMDSDDEYDDPIEELQEQINVILQTLKTVKGYSGAAVLSPQGRLLGGDDTIASSYIRETGPMIYNALETSKEMARESGFGGLDMIQFYTEKGILFTIAGDGGNLPFHTIMMIESNGDIIMAGVKLKKAVEQLAKVI